LGELSAGTELLRFDCGEVLFWENDPCRGLYVINSGCVKLFKTSMRGRELIINVFKEGATFNEVPVFDHPVNPVSVAALGESDVWGIDVETIHQILNGHPEMSRAVIKNLADNLRMLVGKVEELSFIQVTNRLALLINQLPEEQLSGESSMRIPQDQLAARSLWELERSGAILVERRTIKITDQYALDEWTECPQT
jgi:CRP/FNR family transcriptional regulator